ncbi:MAG: DNRLRE domain-containing protein [Algibacter sp.]
MKYMVEAQIDPWYTSYQNMIADSKPSFDYTVRGDLSFTEVGRNRNDDNVRVNNDEIHFVSTGIAIITASQDGDVNYKAAPDIIQNLYVVDAIAGTVNLSVDADTYVKEETASTNYVNDTNMVTKAAAAASRYAYLKFDLSSVPGLIISAKLRLYQRTNNVEERNVYDVVDDSWIETGLTWSNKPVYENKLASLLTSKTWSEWNVSSYTAQGFTNDKVITMVVDDPDNPSTFCIDFYAIENLMNVPELVIEYSNVPLLGTNTVESKIDIYPNLVLNELNVPLVSANLNIKKTNLALYTLSGQRVMSIKTNANMTKLDLSKFNRGVYLLIIKDNSKNITRKIVKL